MDSCTNARKSAPIIATDNGLLMISYELKVKRYTHLQSERFKLIIAKDMVRDNLICADVLKFFLRENFIFYQ